MIMKNIAIIGERNEGLEFKIVDIGRGCTKPIIYPDWDFEPMPRHPYKSLLLEKFKQLCSENYQIFHSYGHWLIAKAPLKRVVSKSYIDDFNERTIGHIYRETIKEACNAFDILQFTGDRSS